MDEHLLHLQTALDFDGAPAPNRDLVAALLS